MKHFILSIIVAAGLLAGCGGNDHPVAYRPIAYGQNNQCYYVNSPEEAIALQTQGLCQSNWTPTIMPLFWHQMYYPYYSSPSYYNVYVPVARRSNYVKSEKIWGSANKGAIAATSKKATYQGSNGKKVAADKIGAAKFGGGARFGPVGTKFGSGSGRAGESVKTPSSKAPSSKAPSSKAPSSKAPSSKAPSIKAPSAPSKSYSGGSGRSFSGGGSRSFSGGSGRR